MKIVVIQPLLPKYSISFFNRIVESNKDIELIIFADIETKNSLNQYDESFCKFNVRHLKSINSSGLIIRPGLLNLLRREMPDVTVFNANPREISQFCAMLIWRILGRRFTAWGMFHRIGGPRFSTNCFFRIVGLLAERCLTYSRIGASNLISLGISKRKIGVVGTAIDEGGPLAERNARSAEELKDFRLQQGIGDRHVVLQVVRLSRIKRPELLVQAAKILLNKRKDILFVLIGAGEMREELEKMVRDNGLQESFRFLGPIYDEKTLSYWYMNASVFVVPTCIGLSAHHAMSYGVPVITDDSLNEQASEFDILAGGLNSLFYEENNYFNLSECIDIFLSDKITNNFFRGNCFRTILLNSLDKKASNFVRFLRNE